MRLMKLLSVLLLSFILLSNVFPSLPARAESHQQGELPAELAQALLAKMTPQERVGQLFLVTMTGPTAEAGSPILDLVTQQHIGGVVLIAQNNNFLDDPDTVPGAVALISTLQTENWTYTQTPVILPSGAQIQFNYVPLFIGISQDGDGYPSDQILSGITTLPDLMAIGATWDSELARQTGEVAGKELSSIGFNLFMGPSLDVLEFPGSSAGTGLGASVFGGDPYWVGLMGQSYISGIHNGSNDRMIVIAKHFPGRGSADRPSGDEVATVRKPLESLKQIELAPFFSVTGNAPSQDETADGLLVSHIRYQGFQGNIRSNTRPVSFDSQALSQILSLSEFSSWRQNGGVLVSDDLGSKTVRSYYDPTGLSFSARLVVRDAFLAGNDLLYLGNIVSSDQSDNHNTIVQIVEFFAQKYTEDPAFAQRVDNSVLRILTMKYRMYGDFSLQTVVSDNPDLSILGQSEAVTFNVAREGVTLISPDPADLAAILANPPSERDHIVYLTDTRPQLQCSNCTQKATISVDALQNAVLHLYGPQGVGLVYPSRMISYSFDDLSAILQGGVGNHVLEYDLGLANWVVISMLESDPAQPDALLRRFFSERQDLLRNKNVIVFAFNAPYYLDATDISKLTAYYGLYSKSAPFIEIAARILFQEITPSGSLPVSVSGIGYDLLSATSPDPGQVIDLALDFSANPVPTGPVGTLPAPTPVYRVGDTITVRTGTIVDHNGHPVPDGTGARFVMTQQGSADIIQQVDSTTTLGVARASFNLDRAGLLELRASSDPANTSVTLQLEITSEGMNVTALPPTQNEGHENPTPMATFTPAPGSSPNETGRPGFWGWIITLITLAGISCLVLWFGSKIGLHRWGIRCALCLLITGLGAYSYLAFGLPGSVPWLRNYGYAGIFWIALVGGLIGLGGGVLWWRLSERNDNEK